MSSKKQFLIYVAAVAIFFACNRDRLDQPALGYLNESDVANRKGVEGLLIGAYAMLDGVSTGNQNTNTPWSSAGSNWIYGSICGSEAYKGGNSPDDQREIIPIEKFESASSNPFFDDKWAALYAGVQRANTVLQVMNKATDINLEDRFRIAAEARFLRGYFHFEAIKMWNKVPYVDETVTYVANNYHLPNDTLIWPAIENDFKFAEDHLPPTQLQAIGRANKYAAKAFLAKVYMFQEKFEEAKLLLEELIDHGVTSGGKKYKLVNYADNFNPATQNNEETVFSTQSSVKDGSTNAYDPGNGNAGDVLNFPSKGPGGGCCSFFQPSQYLVNHFKTDSFTGLPDLYHFNDVDVKSDQDTLSSEPFTPYDGTLDPRLDWTVGRRGIPYLDWGIHTGYEWIGYQPFGGPYSAKKNVYYKEQEGQLSELSFWTYGVSANNINLIRFADVLLWAAEVEAKIGIPDKAREYVNRVRRRAADTSGWVKKQDGSFAAHYKVGEYTNVWMDPDSALNAIRYERMLELGMEGHRFFDLVRWKIAKKEITKYITHERVLKGYLNGVEFKENCNEYFPIPQKQIDLSAGADGIRKMKQNNPCY